MSIKTMTVIGTRPEIIKMAPLIEILERETRHFLIHSGQHYSQEMDGVFFMEMGLRAPDVNLGIGSCPPGEQVGKIIMGVEEAIAHYKPDLLLVHGDTNTTLGSALAVAKHKSDGIKLAHVEAGARSFIPTQAEEVNRLIVDRISDIHYAANESDREHLLAEGYSRKSILVTGNTVLECSLRMKNRIGKDWISKRFKLAHKGYAIATFHRQETVDDPVLLRNIIHEIDLISQMITVVIPLHPRTAGRMEEHSLKFSSNNIRIMDSVGYKDMIALLDGARLCITDSGGLQEEAAVLAIPSFILRQSTEHRKYIECGFHCLVKPPFTSLCESVEAIIISDEKYRTRLNKYGSWGAYGIAQAIFDDLMKRLDHQL